MKTKILIIDDDKALTYSLNRVLSQDYEVFIGNNSKEALEILSKEHISFLLLDYKLSDEDGLEVLEKVKSIYPDLPSVMMTAYGTNNTLINAIKKGAEDFIFKPIEVDEIKAIINKYIDKDVPFSNQGYIKIPDYPVDELIIGTSDEIKDILKMVANIAKTDTPVLITGESGTGKELIANLIQSNSNRSDNPYIVLNCAAIPFELLESELFGYEKGAFSGAFKSKPGKFELADTGTIFLDEIGELPFKLQSKLLRFIQNGVVEKLGATSFKKVDVRIIAATNRNLKELVEEGKFRLDLFYRLNVINIHIPPLRKRKEDIKHLLFYFIKKYSNEAGKNISYISSDVLNMLENYNWPGNVRELQNVIRKIIILAKNNCITEDSIYFIKNGTSDCDLTSDNLIKWIFENFKTNTLNEFISYIEKKLIQEALKIHNGNRSKTAENLGISRVTLNEKINKYGLSNH
ncbi:sigma-54-dependent transcriptional regulator [Calditerrivibrio nitroreducens]|uniref:sigma-54-dependent transcriptional regulator n=1 Tax=Calditerrivibrio nitroreducens TaxID=477976 RepID=UPI003C725297